MEGKHLELVGVLDGEGRKVVPVSCAEQAAKVEKVLGVKG
jgi:hypothetical protein